MHKHTHPHTHTHAYKYTPYPQDAGDKEKAAREAAAELESVSRQLADLKKARDEVSRISQRVPFGVFTPPCPSTLAARRLLQQAVCAALCAMSSAQRCPSALGANTKINPHTSQRHQAANARKEAWRAIDEVEEQKRAVEMEHARAREVRSPAA